MILLDQHCGSGGRATASPLPLAGEGQGGGLHEDLRRLTPSPTLPRKRERGRIEVAGCTEFISSMRASGLL